jgi:hypothetical protein
MRERRDLKGMMPYIKAELQKGRAKKEIFAELDLDQSAKTNIEHYLRRERIEEYDYVESYVIIPPRMRQKKYVTVNGKRYEDITEDIIDCGG